MTGYNQSFHYWSIALKEKDEVTGEYPSVPVRGGIMARGSAFEGEPNMETDDWEAHDGSKSIVLASDRTQVSAEPQWEQKAMFGEFFEDGWYMLLGSYEKKTVPLDGTGSGNVYEWKFYQDLVNPQELPLATIINGYSAVENDAVTYDNAKMSELEYEISNDGINLTYTFGSNAPILNQANPVRTVGQSLSKLGVQNIHIYIGDFGVGLNELTEQQLAQYDYGCVVSSTNSFNTNLEDFLCLGTPFGKGIKDEGKFENDGELEIQWNPLSQHLIDKWYTGVNDGTTVTEDNYFAEILITGTNRKLGEVGGADVYESFSMYLPKVEITNAWSDMSGDETKTINIEYQLVNNGSVSPVNIDIVSQLEDLHWGTPQATVSVQTTPSSSSSSSNDDSSQPYYWIKDEETDDNT